MKKIIIFTILMILSLSGCVRHEGGSAVMPSAVPEKVLTRTAMPSTAVPVVEYEGTDPWDHCSAVINEGTVLRKAADLEPEEYMRRVQITFMIQDTEKEMAHIIQRCMNGELYVCQITPETNCIEPLDLSFETTGSMLDYCSDPDRDGMVIPSDVIARNTAYEWRCFEGTPLITAQIAEPDAAGFDSSLWFNIPKP